MSQPTRQKIFGALAVAVSAAAGALTAGTIPAILAGVGAAAAFLAGLYHPAPAVVATEGK